MRLFYLVFLTWELFFSSLFAQTNIEIKKSKFSIGETLIFHSTILNEDRTVHVALPQSFHKDSIKKYPVIYLLDGSAHEDFIHIAGLVQFCAYPWLNFIPESIVVGISNIDRKKDFTFPTELADLKQSFPSTGGSANFIKFIGTELQPLIGNNYPTTGERTIIGQSLGGLLATEILIKKPDLFENYIIISPSLWWDNQSIFNLEMAETKASKKIFIGVGAEGSIMKSTARKLYKKLKHQQVYSTSDINFEYFNKINHADILHTAVYSAFKTLFENRDLK